MKKILFVTTRNIYPTNDGRKVVLYNYCKGLSKQLNCEVRLFIIDDFDEVDNEKIDFISRVYYGNRPNFIEKVKNLVIETFILKKWPLQVSVYYSKRTQKELDKVIYEYNPDVVICDMSRTAEYLKKLDESKYNKILDMDDLLSKRYKRQLESNIISNNTIGSYAKKLPKLLRVLTYSSFVNKNILLKESRLLGRYELNIADRYRSIIFVSPIEANEFNNILNKNKCKSITIGVDYNYFSKKVVLNKQENPTIVFLGNMNVAHNKDSVQYFLKDIFPNVLKEIPNCKFRIVGKCDNSYIDEMKKYDNVEVTGEVDDIRKYVQGCNVGMAVLLYGTGIKTKVLELMAMGIPVITNDIGNEGIGLTNNKQVILQNDTKSIIEKLIYLLQNKDAQELLGKEGQRFVKETHQWEKIIPKFDEIL